MPITSLAPNAQTNARQLMSAKNAVKHNPAPMFKGGAPEADQFSKAHQTEIMEKLAELKKNGVLEQLNKFIALVTTGPAKSETPKAGKTQAPKEFSEIRASVKPEHIEVLDKFQECIDKATEDHQALKETLATYAKALQAFKDQHKDDKELAAKVKTFDADYKDESGLTLAQLRTSNEKAQKAKTNFTTAKKSYEADLMLYHNHEKLKGTMPKDTIEGWQRGFNGNIGWMEDRGIKLLPFQEQHLKDEAQKAKEKSAKEAEKKETPAS